MNRNLAFSKLCLGIALLAFAGCSDDEVSWPEVDGAAPKMELKTDHIRTDKGYNITVKGELADADGIATIDLVCPTLHLNKTIDLISIYGEPQTTYSLDYSHPIREEITQPSHTITVTVTDVGGRTVSKNILVTMDADFAAPAFTVVPGEELTVLIKDPTMLKVKFSIEDNKKLSLVQMILKKGEFPRFGGESEGEEGEEKPAETVDTSDMTDDEINALINEQQTRWMENYFDLGAEELESIGFGGDELSNTYSYENAFQIPDEEGTYTLAIFAADAMGHVITHHTQFNVQELPDFEQMYLADVEDARDLNSDVFGVPVLIDHIDAYTYEARYYNATAGTKICFLPQNTDFTPICFAPAKDDPNTLGDDIDSVDKFVLDQAGVYYHFTFNTLTREYSYETYSLADAHDPVENMTPGANHLNQWQAWGADISKADWRTWNIGVETWIDAMYAPLQRDRNNPHLWRTEPFKLEAGQFSFIIANYHDNGWWGYTEWRADNETNIQKCKYLGMWFDDNPQFKGNDAFFNQKYGMVPGFTKDKWNNQSGYKNNFVQDTWFKPNVRRTGNYIFEVDMHTEDCRLVPAN